jgi:pimeloyl-ACP methyl ester carboxylesterase
MSEGSRAGLFRASNAHVGEVVDVMRAQRDDVVLVGQSYGGMIVSGAADAEPSRLRALVNVDAYVPDSGCSVWSLTTFLQSITLSGQWRDVPRKTFIGGQGRGRKSVLRPLRTPAGRAGLVDPCLRVRPLQV